MITAPLKSSNITGGSLTSGAPVNAPSAPKLEFKNILAETKNGSSPRAKDLHAEIVQLQQRIERGDAIDARELILYQIKAGQFGLEVEMVSKVAEAGLSTARKFQSQQ